MIMNVATWCNSISIFAVAGIELQHKRVETREAMWGDGVRHAVQVHLSASAHNKCMWCVRPLSIRRESRRVKSTAGPH